ncbi:hypothetical protein OGAPHI_000568 [Ogataea philodendri]|uniref:Amino acid permease/ SLC12A domain-containing protein n=1 Tax=Ogataea philodendri TaxID=1378263 RepID=A0A9P8TAH3_9ASCO|nr:uncharacterized protein OGAPHI_000568 [Ogataea philodendri]KAH3671345.1 hypothetical protein OGAPHI_000568 [Ogataea philodendri]
MKQDEVVSVKSLKNVSSAKNAELLQTVSVTEVGISKQFIFDEDDTKLEKALKQRQLGMITLVGVFGTGLFLSSGGTLAKTGPVGMCLAYLIIGVVVGLNQIALAEVAALAPLTGSSIRHAEIFIDEAVGFALGWLKVWNAILPGALVSTALVMQYWTTVSPGVWITVFIVPIAITNIFSIKLYGEIEFVFALLKIALILILILAGLVLDLGGVKEQPRLGFHYWKHPGPFAEHFATGSVGRFVGFWSALSSVVYSYGGVQAIALLAGETKNPRTNIPKAAKRILYRVVGLYMLAVFILSLIVPYDDKNIATSDGTAAHSPYVIAFERGGIKVLPHIVNALTLCSAWSEANLNVMQVSRIMFSLAAKHQAPAAFLKTNKLFRVPVFGVVLALLFCALAYMTLNSTASNVFSWFQNLSSSVLLLEWIIISISNIRMNKALVAQGYTRKDLPYTNPIGIAGAWISLLLSVLFLVTGGFTTFMHGHWDTSVLVSSYCSPMIFIILYAGWKLFYRTEQWQLQDICLPELFDDYHSKPEPTPEPLRGWRIITFLWA